MEAYQDQQVISGSIWCNSKILVKYFWYQPKSYIIIVNNLRLHAQLPIRVWCFYLVQSGSALHQSVMCSHITGTLLYLFTILRKLSDLTTTITRSTYMSKELQFNANFHASYERKYRMNLYSHFITFLKQVLAAKQCISEMRYNTKTKLEIILSWHHKIDKDWLSTRDDALSNQWRRQFSFPFPFSFIWCKILLRCNDFRRNAEFTEILQNNKTVI